MSDSIESTRAARWHRRALRAFQAGDLETAAEDCRRALERDPEHADATYLAAACALKQGRPADALPGLVRAVALAADRAEYWAELGRCLALLGRAREALNAAEKAAALLPGDAVSPSDVVSPGDADAFSPGDAVSPDDAVTPGNTATAADAAIHDAIGAIFTLTDRHKEAVESFGTAARLSPGNAEYLYHFATSLTFCGELRRAEAAFERVLEIDPHHAMTHLALAENLAGAPPPGRIEQLEAILARVRGNVDAELTIRHALGRTLEAAGETSRAFAHWEQGKRAKKAAVGYTIEQDKALFRAVENMFPLNGTPETRPGAVSSAPVFVIGMPRTGTTLVERILSSHSMVATGGELISLPKSIREASGVRQAYIIDPESLPKALEAHPKKIGDRYLELAAEITGRAQNFVDKQPLNFLYVGFIRRALPNARIVCLRRNPLDTCLAGFRHLFAANFRYYRYALTLEDSAEYFALFTRLIAHWDTLFPAAIHHVQYERLVTDFDAEVRRLLDYLELDFEQAVGDFSRNPAPVATASAVQVRQALHQRSVGAWRRYEKELEPLRRRLTELGIDPDVFSD